MALNMTSKDKNTISIGLQDFTLVDLQKVLFDDHQVILSSKALNEVNDSYLFLEAFSKGKLIYGINTGFGPMAQYRIADNDLQQLQYNLIRSHCSGTGKLLTNRDIKSMMIARLTSLMRAHSGVNIELVELLKTLINNEIYPCIYEHGGVGASGDLGQ
jgi:histidine ammonia-lyase